MKENESTQNVKNFSPSGRPATPHTEGVGARVRAVRRQHRLRQVEMAERLGMSVSQYSKIEIGQRGLNAEAMRKFCELFGVSSDWVLYERGAGPRQPRMGGDGLEWNVGTAAKRPELPADWIDTLCGLVKMKRHILEIGYGVYGLPLDQAIAPLIREFEETLGRGSDEKE